MKNKNILVTGASGGIGKIICKVLKQSYNVFGTSRTEKALMELNIKDYCVCDFDNEKDLNKISDFVKDNNINILINNAGEYVYETSDKLSLKNLEHIFYVNSIMPMFLSSLVIPQMKNQKWGRIVNVGSISGVMGEACASAYSATKASLIGFTKAAALELAQDNITVNTINPGWVETTLGENSIEQSEFSKEEIIECVPQKRFVEPVEIANLIKYLISDEAKGVTGQSINLCAGLSVGF